MNAPASIHVGAGRLQVAIDVTQIARQCKFFQRKSDLASRSEEPTSELQSLMRISYAVFCLTTPNNPLYTLSQPTLYHTSSIPILNSQHHTRHQLSNNTT